jgi:periplasmic divalent cation tolerance protein
MNEILVLSTADSIESAHRIASALVEGREAACVNLVAGIRSVYRWGGKLCEEGEVLMLIKSTTDRFEDVRATIRRLHTYQVPEVIALPITDGDDDYLFWLAEQVRPEH